MNIQISKVIEGLQLVGFSLGFVTAMFLPGQLISGQEINSGGAACTAIAIISVLVAALIKRQFNLIFVTLFQILIFACPLYILFILIEITNNGFKQLFGRAGIFLVILIFTTALSFFAYRWLQSPKKA